MIFRWLKDSDLVQLPSDQSHIQFQEKFDGLRDSIESERQAFSLQVKKFEDERKHSYEVLLLLYYTLSITLNSPDILSRFSSEKLDHIVHRPQFPKVKDKLTEEVVRLREVWADSQEQVCLVFNEC